MAVMSTFTGGPDSLCVPRAAARLATRTEAPRGALVAYGAGAIWGLSSFAGVFFSTPLPGIYFLLTCVSAACVLLFAFAPIEHAVRLRNVGGTLLLLGVWVAVGMASAIWHQTDAVDMVALAGAFREPFVLVSFPALLRLIQSGFANVNRFVTGLLIAGGGLLVTALATRPMQLLESEEVRLGEQIGLNANALGYIGATVALVTLSRLLDQRGRATAVCGDAGLFGISSLTVILTKSRTSLICLVLGGLYVLFRAPRSYRKYLTCGAILLLVGMRAETMVSLSRWEITTGQHVSTTPLAGREDYFQEGWHRFLESPLFGQGFSDESFHSGYLDAAVKTGALGLGAVLLVLAMATAKSFRSRLPVHWPQAILYVGLAQALVEPRILGYGSVSAACLTLSLLLLVTEDSARGSGPVDNRDSEFVHRWSVSTPCSDSALGTSRDRACRAGRESP
jgi:hypothetical protein